MKKSLKNLRLKKQTISNPVLNKVKGGDFQVSQTCNLTLGCNSNGCQTNFCGNSVPVAQGGIGCVIK